MAVRQWDTLVQGGLVIDGSGALPRVEDIALAGGRVVARGPELDAAQAREVVDARGQWVMPGMLDIHTHLDLEVELNPGVAEVVRHGTTTVLVSNCSLGLAFGAQRRNGEDPIVDCFARVENIPKHVLQKVVDRVDWSDSGAYLEHLDELPLGPNIAPMIPHSMLRAEVMGLQQSVSREPTPKELQQMADLVEKGMQEGYVGFSTDALPFHYLANDPHRRTKIPSQWCSFEELKLLTGVVRRHGRLWQATPPKDNPLQVLRNFLLTSGRLYGRPLRTTAVAALDLVTNGGLSRLAKILPRLLNSRLLGGRFRFQALAAPFKVYWDGPINPLAEEIDEMRELNEPDLADVAARRRLLDDAAFQERFRKMWMHGKSGFNLANLARLVNRERMAFGRRLDEMFIHAGGAPEWQGESMGAVHRRLRGWQQTGQGARSEAEAAEFAKAPKPVGDEVGFMLHVFREYDTGLRWWYVSANRDPRKVRDLLFDEQNLPGFNDSGAHLTNMAFYDGNLRGLQMAQQEGLLRVAAHVRRLTRDPADFIGIDAGRIDIGSRADVVVIDPEALAKYDSEANSRFIFREDIDHEQMVNRSDGVVSQVFIAGQLAWAGDAATPALGTQRLGRALRARDHEQNHGTDASPRRLADAA